MSCIDIILSRSIIVINLCNFSLLEFSITSFIDFLKTIKLGNYFKFLTYKLVNGDYIGRIDYKRTVLYFIKQNRFYNFLHLRTKKKRIKGYIIGTVKKGLSVTINGMIAFLPISQILKYRKKKKSQLLLSVY